VTLGGMHGCVAAAAKVTVAIDGSALYDGVEVFIQSIQVRDIPTSCFIGRDNTAGEDGIIEEGEKFIINETMDSEGPSVSNASPLLYVASETGAGKVETASESLDDTHTDSTPALYFYENKQGTGKDKTQVDKDDDGKPDDADLIKDDKPYGTYVEVVAYYVSTNEKRPGCGTIRYRFMLGKDIYNDYDAERNYHYKLTLLLKYFANDPDWHIEYDQQILEVSMPEIFNYQGKVFAPDSSLANFGHNFIDKNPIKVLSYTKGKKDGEDVRVDEPWTATFDYVDENGRNVVNSPNPPSWLFDFPVQWRRGAGPRCACKCGRCRDCQYQLLPQCRADKGQRKCLLQPCRPRQLRQHSAHGQLLYCRFERLLYVSPCLWQRGRVGKVVQTA